MRSIILIPTFNEIENIVHVVRSVAAIVPDCDLMVVDDNSPDGTADLAASVCREHRGYSVLRRTGKHGLGCAYIEAFKATLAEGYDRILQMDADMSHNPTDLPALLRAADGAGLVIGSRYCPGGRVLDWPTGRILLSRFANVYVKAILGLRIDDTTAGFRCWHRDALHAVNLDSVQSTGYSFMVDMTYRAARAGVAIQEVPICFRDRTRGCSKMSRAVILEAIMMPWRLRLNRRHLVAKSSRHSPKLT